MFIILNWWYNETITNALLVCKDDESGDIETFETREKAELYAKENLNGDYKIIEG